MTAYPKAAWRLALLGGASKLAVGLAGPALAQDGPEPVTEAPDDEEIVVTGSRVRGAAPVGSSVISLGTP